MKIAIFNGSPRKATTSAMVKAFCEGAQAAGHEVTEYPVGRMKLGGCLACEHCHTSGSGVCIQKDDFEKLLPAYQEADMLVFASPIYYFTMTAQMEAAIQRGYCVGKPLRAKKVALLLTAASPNVFDAAVAQLRSYAQYCGLAIAGVVTSHGDENQSEQKLSQIRALAQAL